MTYTQQLAALLARTAKPTLPQLVQQGEKTVTLVHYVD